MIFMTGIETVHERRAASQEIFRFTPKTLFLPDPVQAAELSISGQLFPARPEIIWLRQEMKIKGDCGAHSLIYLVSPSFTTIYIVQNITYPEAFAVGPIYRSGVCG